MAFELPTLPYANDAVLPHISSEALAFHYDKHHRTYAASLNNLIAGTELEGQALEQIIKNSTGSVFNNATQVWNHSFYWNCLVPNAGGLPQGLLAIVIDQEFGSFGEFKEEFTKTAIGTFGSGWGACKAY